MKTFRRVVFVVSGLSALSLAGCGEGYQMEKFYGSVPYTKERTAGPGIRFVLSHMMPEKSVVLPETVITPVAPQVKDAEPMFEKKLSK